MNADIPTAACYIRVSTDEQTEFSPNSQLKAIAAYADKNRLSLSDKYIFVDEGISGRSAEKRPEFNRMIALAKTSPKPFDTILLWKFSRFARNQEESIVYKAMLKKLGITVTSISEPVSAGAFGGLIERIIEWSDEYYSINLAQEVKRGMEEKARRGGVVTSPPFGYKMEDGIFRQEENSALAVKLIFDKFIQGMSCKEIAKLLNDSGIKTKRSNAWDSRGVKYVLQNSVYTGRLHWRPDKASSKVISAVGNHAPIITDSVWEKAQERISRSKTLYKSDSRAAPADYMLKGVVKCGECGAALTRLCSTGSLQCSRYSKGRCKISHCVSVVKITDFVLSRLRSDFGGGNAEIRLRRGDNASAPVLYDALIKKECQKLLRIKEAYLNGVDSLNEYKKNKSECERAIERLKAGQPLPPGGNSPEQTHADVKYGLFTLLNDDNVSEAEKNIILKSMISAVYLHRPSNAVDIIYY